MRLLARPRARRWASARTGGSSRYSSSSIVLVNAFVGARVGLERTVLPLLGEREFGLASKSAALSFVATFGVVKALTNLLAGRVGDRYGRKHVLVAGWLFALPVPFLVICAPTWGWIVLANVLSGINQGLAWSTAVIMKIDLVGPRQRGLAMGFNEFAGYLAVVGDVAHPVWRGSAVGVYRLWRDLGYAVGALLAGVLADAFGMATAIGAVAAVAAVTAVTAASGLPVAARMPETLRRSP